MFEAYSVAVRVSLINGVSSGLIGMIKQFKTAEVGAAALKKELRTISGLMLVGGGLTAAGMGIFAALEKTVSPAREYAHQLNIMNMNGLKQVEISQAISAAWKNTGTVVTTTATDNLKSMVDLRNVLGSMKDATWALPIVTKVGAAMAASSEGKVSAHSQDIAFSMAKALDIIGAAKDPQTFAREAGMMSQVVTAFQNRVTPAMFQGVFQYARQAKFDMSDEFKYQILPTLMLESSTGGKSGGGGSRGVGPMQAALYRITNQGYVNKKALPILERLGLLIGKPLKTSTPDTVVNKLKGSDLAARNSFLWEQQIVGPAIRKLLHIDSNDHSDKAEQRIRNVLGNAFRGNQLATAELDEFESKPGNFYRDQKIIQGAMPYGAAYESAVKNDPELQFAALNAQWKNFITGIGLQVLPDVMTVVKGLVPMVHDLAMWTQKNPDGVRKWVHSFELLGVALAASGGATMLVGFAKILGLAFKAIAPLAAAGKFVSSLPLISTAIEGVGGFLAAITLPEWGAVALVAAAIAGAGAAVYEAWKHWDTSKGVFTNVKNEIVGFWNWVHHFGEKAPAPGQLPKSTQPFRVGGLQFPKQKEVHTGALVAWNAFANAFSKEFTKHWDTLLGGVKVAFNMAWAQVQNVMASAFNWMAGTAKWFHGAFPWLFQAEKKAVPAKPTAKPGDKKGDLWGALGGLAAKELWSPLQGLEKIFGLLGSDQKKSSADLTTSNHALAAAMANLAGSFSGKGGVAYAPHAAALVHHTTNVHVDGKLIQKVVERRMVKRLNGPSHSGIHFDPTGNIMPQVAS